MGQYLRIVKHAYYANAHAWLEPSSAADVCRRDFTQRDNEISLFYIEDNAILERVVLAYLLTRRQISTIGYRVLSEERLEHVHDKIVKRPGVTIDPTVNDIHYDLVGATEAQRLRVAFDFGRYGSGGHWGTADIEPRLKRAFRERIYSLGMLGEIRGDVERLLSRPDPPPAGV